MGKTAKLATNSGASASSAVIVRSVRESALWVLGALALIMLLALVTYDKRDPGFSNTGDGSEYDRPMLQLPHCLPPLS